MSALRRHTERVSGAYAVVALLIVVLEVVAALQRESLLLQTLLDPRLGQALAAGVVGGALLLLVGGVTVMALQRARPPRSHGRGRLLAVGVGGALNGLGSAAAFAIAALPESTRLLDAGLGLTVPEALVPGLYAAVAVGVVGAVTLIVGCAATFPMIPQQVRRRAFLVVDVILVVAVIAAVAFLPARPPTATPNALALPVLRLLIVTSALVRLLIRAMPRLLSLIESAGFRSLVAARHLRSKKSGFLTIISLLSVGAVTLSCVALTTTLSVMGGFRSDLKRKILGNNAHIVIDREHGPIEGWQPLLDTIEKVPLVSGVSAFANGEVMLSSASNISTAVLRGIDPARIGKVNDLPRNLTSGKLAYLTHPEQLLSLPKDAPRDLPLLLGPSKLDENARDTKDAGVADAGAATPAGASAAGIAGAASVAGALGEKPDPRELKRRIEALETFLRDAKRPGAPANEGAESRELLPGIVIGQELARALRLYVGDEVNVVAPLGALGPSGPMPKARAFRVAGIFYSGMYEYDMKFTYVALETAQKFLNMGDAISGIEVRVNDIDRAPLAANEIRAKLNRKTLRVRDWQELNSRLFGALALEKLAMFVALGIAILVASFCIAGTLTLMVQEKGREVAILKTMGTSDRAVVGVFVIEGGLIGLLGAALGLFFGYVACFAAEHFGIRMNPEVYYIDRLPVHIDLTEFALTGLAAVLVCLLITIYPALLASRLRPVDALRYE